LQAALTARNHAEGADPVAYSDLIRRYPGAARHDPSLTTVFSSVQTHAARWRNPRRGHLVPIFAAGLVATGALALVIYLLWPTWTPDSAKDAGRLPVSVGATLFNVPTQAFRVKVQKHSGPQERVDLSFSYPGLAAEDQPRHVGAGPAEDAVQSIDRIFLSIWAHQNAMAPDARLQNIYPRYLDPTSPPAQDGLTMRAFREGSPYSGEDLFLADTPGLVARCSRDAATPGMCLSERRIGGADLRFRFPRRWLAQWRDVAGAMDQLTARLTSPHG
jgi:hypothetical protein